MLGRYDQYADAWDTSVTVNIDEESVRYFHTREKGVDRVWVDHEGFLAKVRTFISSGNAACTHVLAVEITVPSNLPDLEDITVP